MTSEIDVYAAQAAAAPAERLLILTTDDDGAPPTINRVVGDYNQIIRLVNWLDNAGALLRYEALGHGDDQFLDRFRERVFAVETAAGPTEKRLQDLVDDFSVITRQASHPSGVARVLEAKHKNPLETLILYGAGALAVSLLSAAFAYSTIKRAQAAATHQQAVADALDKLVETACETIKHGNKTKVESAIKLAKVLIEAGPKILSEKLKLAVSPTKLTFEAGAAPGGKG
jgi:hypothetical protein